MGSTPPEPHPPEPPAIPVESLRRLLAGFPDDWHISIEDASLLLVFDAAMTPRGAINVIAGTFQPINTTNNGVRESHTRHSADI